MQPEHAHDGSGVGDHVSFEERLCNEIAALRQELARQKKIVAHLLKQIEVGREVCTGPNCEKEFLWVMHANGRRTPYDFDGMPHHATCVDVERFQRRK